MQARLSKKGWRGEIIGKNTIIVVIFSVFVEKVREILLTTSLVRCLQNIGIVQNPNEGYRQTGQWETALQYIGGWNGEESEEKTKKKALGFGGWVEG